MNVRVTCQACGAVISLDAALGHEGASEAVQVALRLPAPIGKLLVQYVGLFRPAKRQLSMDRLAKLLGELLTMIESARVERNGRSYVAPLDYWRMALEDMLTRRDKLTLPLDSHGYLLSIIVGMADKAEARQEAKTEQDRRHPIATPVASVIKAVRKQAPVKLGDVLKNLNKGGKANDDQA